MTDPALFRMVLVVSVAVALAAYTRLHLVGGGSVAGGFFAILAFAGQWQTILGVSLVSLLTLIVVRGFILRVLALPRSADFFLSVLSGALITVGFLAATPGVEAVSGFVGVAIAFGIFVVPGLLAYDISRQGFPRGMLGLGVVTGGTVAICLPAALLIQQLPPGTPPADGIIERIPPALVPFGIIAAIVIGGMLRLAFGLRDSGYLGAFFLVEFFTFTALVTVILAALVTHLLVRAYTHSVPMSPRQRSMTSLVLGLIVAWVSLYAAASLGWVPAMQANAYTLSPLLAVGLMAADMGRTNSGVLRTIVGTVLAAAAIALGIWLAQTYGLAVGVAYLVVLALPVIPVALTLRRTYAAAAAAGRARIGTITP